MVNAPAGVPGCRTAVDQAGQELGILPARISSAMPPCSIAAPTAPATGCRREGSSSRPCRRPARGRCRRPHRPACSDAAGRASGRRRMHWRRALVEAHEQLRRRIEIGFGNLPACDLFLRRARHGPHRRVGRDVLDDAGDVADEQVAAEVRGPQPYTSRINCVGSVKSVASRPQCTTCRTCLTWKIAGSAGQLLELEDAEQRADGTPRARSTDRVNGQQVGDAAEELIADTGGSQYSGVAWNDATTGRCRRRRPPPPTTAAIRARDRRRTLLVAAKLDQLVEAG